MTMFLAPYTAIADIDGSPLDAGFLFFGEYGKDPELFPIEVFWDADFTIPAAQPIRTRNGYPIRNGSPCKIYLKQAEHSLVVKNKNLSAILVEMNNKGISSSLLVRPNGDTVETSLVEIDVALSTKASSEYVDNQVGLMAPQATTYNKSEVDTALALKAPQATTYTKAEVDTTFAAYVGGRKAFTTLALAQAGQSTLTANTVVDVTNDPDPAKNGTYQWNGTTLTKSAYDPLTQAKAYTDSVDKKLRLDSGIAIDIESLVMHPAWPSTTSGLWLKSSNYTGYILELATGVSYTITGNEMLNTLVYTFNGGLAAATGVIRVADVKTLGLGETYTVTGSGEYDSIWVSAMDGAQDKKPTDWSIDDPSVHKKDVLDNVYAGEKNQPSSALTVKELAQNLTSLKSQVTDELGDKEFKSLGIRGLAGAFTDTNNTLYIYRDLAPNVARMTLPLAVGDVLEFNYSPIIGSTLMRHTGATSGHTILGQTFNDNSIVRYYKHIATHAADYSICNFINGSVKVNGMPVDLSAVTVLQNDNRLQGVAKKALRETPEWLIYESTSGIKVNRGDIIRIKGVVKGAVAVWANPNLVPPQPAAHWWLAVCSVPDNHPTDTIEWVANESMEVFLQGYVGAEYSIKRSASLKNALLENRKPIEPDSIVGVTLPPIETVFATHLSFILKTEMIDDVEHIAISQNLGKTWTYTPNIIGKIVNYHFFTDGTILLSSEKECYWTDDYVTLNKSTILQKDGTPWVRESENSLNFFGQQNGDKPMFVDGQEIYVWGEYAIGSTTVGVWYTTDFGRTIKRAVDFVGENFNGVPVTARHIHKVYYHAKQETFYVMTGDNDNENMLVKAKYSPSTDTWSWDVLGQGHKYKFGNMWCDDYYAYFTTDYTVSEFKDYWGIIRVGLQHLDDPSKFRLAWDAKAGGWGGGSPYRFIADRNGNKVLIGELYTYGYIMVATTGYDFKRVNLNEPVVLSFIIGPNDNGDIYMKADLYGRGLAKNSGQRLTGGTVNITKMLRNAGLVNFMTGEQNIPHLPFTSE